MFLTPDQLHELTGYVRPSAQARWLRDHRYPYEVAADGRPRVLREHVVRRLGGEEVVEPEPRLRLP